MGLEKSHYSPKYARCYMLWHSYALDEHLNVYSHWETLFEVFEMNIRADKHLSTPPRKMSKESCFVHDGEYHTADCVAYEAYVKDHLES